VVNCLLKPEEFKQTDISNKKVYLISRGCVYEQNKSCFKIEGLSRTFTAKNKMLDQAQKNA